VARRTLILVSAALLAGCQAQPEDQRTAVHKALRFATLAAVEQRFRQAYGMLSEDERKRTTEDELEQGIRSQHSRHSTAFPTRVSAIEYSLVPKYDGMRVYLIGDQRPVPLYYQIAMQRISGRWYPVGFDASEQPFPNSGSTRLPAGK